MAQFPGGYNRLCTNFIILWKEPGQRHSFVFVGSLDQSHADTRRMATDTRRMATENSASGSEMLAVAQGSFLPLGQCLVHDNCWEICVE